MAVSAGGAARSVNYSYMIEVTAIFRQGLHANRHLASPTLKLLIQFSPLYYIVSTHTPSLSLTIAMASPLASGSRTPASSPLSRGSSKPQARVSHIFKPRLPLDPIVEKHEPWRLALDNVISATNAQGRRDVFLVLGGEYTHTVVNACE